MRALATSNRVRVGMIGIILVLLVTAVGQSFTGVPMLFARATYYGQFANSGGLHPGDKVRIAGLDVGAVHSLAIDGDHVVVGFDVGSGSIGTDSTLTIRTDTILGSKVLEIQPRGTRPLRANGVLPIEQGTTPYQIYDAFSDVTEVASGWDTTTIKQSLNVLTETIEGTFPHLSAALDGVSRFADTVGKRDEDLKRLLANTNKLASVVGERSTQIDDLLVNAQTLLGAVNARGQAVEQLLENISALSNQVQGFVDDNPNLNQVLEQFRAVSDQLLRHKDDLANVLSTLSRFTASVSEAVSSGPYFKVMVVNLLPYQMLQPFVDAAFKKRGIDPEQFWRNAGLPAFRFPDPNGPRSANGAPPPAPSPLEGTPEHPGPAVPPGSPCSYTPPAGELPRPENPLPCAHATQGPYGPVPGGYGPPAVATSDPNLHGPQPSPGVPAAAVPGQLPPDVPGAPAALAPGPPGARTAPLPAPPDFTPAIAPLPPAPAGPAPGGPPLVPPGSQG